MFKPRAEELDPSATDTPEDSLGDGSTLLACLRVANLTLALLCGILLATLACVLSLITRKPLPVRGFLTQIFMKSLSAALPLRIRVVGQVPDQPMLWVANHTSWTDIPLLGRLAPLSFLSKAEVADWPLAGWLAKQGATLFIQRGAGQSEDLAPQMRGRLMQGRSVALFPEGTSSDGRQLLPFHGRLLSALTDTHFALQPVAISYLRNGEPCPLAPFVGDDDLLHHLWRLFKQPAIDAVVELLPPIASDGRNRSLLARLAREAIADARGLELPTKKGDSDKKTAE